MLSGDCTVVIPAVKQWTIGESVCDLKVWKSGAPSKVRKFLGLPGFGTGFTVRTFSSNVQNMVAAISGRVLQRKLNGQYVALSQFVPVEGTVYRQLEGFATELLKNSGDSAPLPFDLFIAQYCGLKKRNYERAREEYIRRGFRPSDAHIKIFLKYEKTIHEFKPQQIPRVISPAGAVYLMLTGCYIKSVEKKIYSRLNQMLGYTCVAKGINYDELAQITLDNWNEIPNCVCFDLDVEKLDASICKEALQWTIDIIVAQFVGLEAKEIRELLHYQLISNVTGRTSNGGVKYRVEGTLTSGQMNTSLTGILLVIGALYEPCLRYNCRFTNCGDDVRIFVPRSAAYKFKSLIKSRFTALGLIVKMSDPIADVRCTEFCQTQVIRVQGKWTSVRQPWAALTKDSFCIDNLTAPHKIGAWMAAVGRGGLATHSGVPMMQAFYKMMVKHGINLQVTKLTGRQRRRIREYLDRLSRESEYWGEPLSPRTDVITDEARIDFFVAFGVTPATQIIVEKHYEGLLFDPKFCDNYLYSMIHTLM